MAVISSAVCRTVNRAPTCYGFGCDLTTETTCSCRKQPVRWIDLVIWVAVPQLVVTSKITSVLNISSTNYFVIDFSPFLSSLAFEQI